MAIPPDESTQFFAEKALRSANLYLNLFTNDVTIGTATVAGSLTVATGGGYAEKTLSGTGWTTGAVASGTCPMSYAEQTFTFTGTVGNVYGWAVSTGSALTGSLVAVGKFPVEQMIGANGDAIAMTPQIVAVMTHSGTSGGFETPQDGDEMNEGFIGVGYELGAAWSESPGSGTLDPDASLPGSPPAGSGTEGLHVTANGQTYAEWTRGSAIADGTNTDLFAEFYLTSTGWALPPYTGQSIFNWSNGAGGGGFYPVRIDVYRNAVGTGVPTRMRAYSSVSGSSAWENISMDTWYSMFIHLDATAANSYFKFNGTGANQTFTRGTGAGRYLSIGAIYGWATGETADLYFGRVYIDTP